MHVIVDHLRSTADTAYSVGLLTFTQSPLLPGPVLWSCFRWAFFCCPQKGETSPRPAPTLRGGLKFGPTGLGHEGGRGIAPHTSTYTGPQDGHGAPPKPVIAPAFTIIGALL